jgi:hypothetical protein
MVEIGKSARDSSLNTLPISGTASPQFPVPSPPLSSNNIEHDLYSYKLQRRRIIEQRTNNRKFEGVLEMKSLKRLREGNLV